MKKQIVLLAMALTAISGIATAQIDYEWTSGTGDWLDVGWSPADPVWDSNADANIIDGIMNLTPTSRPTNSIHEVFVVPAGGSPILNISGDLSGHTFLLGHDGNTGTATANQTAGTFTTTGENYIGYKGTSANTYNLSGGTFVGGTNDFYISRFAGSTGILNINGGTLESDAYNFALADGTAFMTVGNGGTLTHTGSDYFMVGRSGDGVVHLNTGGTITSTANNMFALGYNSTASGILNVDGGNLTHTGSDYFIVGRLGTGTLNMNGGTVESSATKFTLGYTSNASGTLNLTNGTLKTTGSQLILAEKGSAVATANVVGGTLECASDYLDLGLSQNAIGTLNLSGGLVKFTGNYLRVGIQANGVLNQSGGVLETTTLILADKDTGSGLYTVSGGSFDASSYVQIKYADSTFEVDGSGATSIETRKLYSQNGTLRINLDEDGSTLIRVGDGGIELSNTLEVDTLAGFDGVAGSTYDLMWTANGFLTNGMSFVDNSGVGFDWRIVAKDGGEVFQVMVPGGTPSEIWAIGYGLSGDDVAATADPDNDGFNNLYEYGLGGDPTNSADTGISPVYGTLADGGTNWFEYIYPKRSDVNSGLTYHLELTDNLIYPDWANSGYTVMGTGTIDDDFDAVTNRVSAESKDEQFIRLIIEE